MSIDANFLVQVHSGIWSLTHTMNCWDLDDFVSTLSPPPPLNPISSKKSISVSIENSIRHSFQMMFWNRIDYPFGLFNKRLNSVYLLSVFLGKIKYDVLNLVLLNKSFPPGLMFKPEHVYLKNCNDTKRTSSSLTHHSKMH